MTSDIAASTHLSAAGLVRLSARIARPGLVLQLLALSSLRHTVACRTRPEAEEGPQASPPLAAALPADFRISSSRFVIRVTVRNASDDVVTVRAVDCPACGMSVDFQPRELAAGMSGVLVARGRRHGYGERAVGVAFLVEAGGRQSRFGIEVPVTFVADYDLTLSAANDRDLLLHQVAAQDAQSPLDLGPATELAARVKPRSGATARGLKLQSALFELADVVRDGDGLAAIATPKVQGPGVYYDELEFLVDDTVQLTVPVHLTYAAPWHVEPLELSISHVPRGQLVRRQIVVRFDDPSDVWSDWTVTCPDGLEGLVLIESVMRQRDSVSLGVAINTAVWPKPGFVSAPIVLAGPETGQRAYATVYGRLL
jgi:hypothetical protein